MHAVQRVRQRPRRHPPGGGYARGEATRRRIVETAIEMFGASGYERTSTRAIARRAAVSLPALQYYFGGKEGLLRACAEYITADVRARLEPAIAQVQDALATGARSRRELLALLERVLEPFLEAMATERPESWVLFFTRAQSERSPAFDVLFEGVVGRIIGVTAAILARLLACELTDPEVLIRALSMIGPVALLRRGRPLLLRALGWPDFGAERLALVKQVLWRQISLGLTPQRAKTSAPKALRSAAPAYPSKGRPKSRSTERNSE